MLSLAPTPRARIRPIHILIIPSWYPAHPGEGLGSFFRNQAIALARQGNRVGVVTVRQHSLKRLLSLSRTSRGNQWETDSSVETLRHSGFDWFPRLPRLSAPLWLRHGRKLCETYIERNGCPDIIHAHAVFNAGVLARWAARKFGTPFVLTEHSSGFGLGVFSPAQMALALEVTESAAMRLSVSDALIAQMAHSFGKAESDWVTVPNILGNRFEQAGPAPPLPVSPFVLLSVSFLTDNKRVNLILEAFCRAFAKDERVQLRIGGDGQERARLEALAVRLGLGDRVTFLGLLSRAQVMEEISRCHALVLASRYETFGVVVIEALSQGRPVIATRCGGPDEVVRTDDGLLVPVDDMEGLAEAMRRMRDSYAIYDRHEIRTACLERFRGSVVAERLVQLYREVADVTGNRAR